MSVLVVVVVSYQPYQHSIQQLTGLKRRTLYQIVRMYTNKANFVKKIETGKVCPNVKLPSDSCLLLTLGVPMQGWSTQCAITTG